jgi:hypothetical protein
MRIPFIDPHMFGKPINPWNDQIINLNQFPCEMLMYLLKSLSLLVRKSYIMSTYFWIVDAPTLTTNHMSGSTFMIFLKEQL